MPVNLGERGVAAEDGAQVGPRAPALLGHRGDGDPGAGAAQRTKDGLGQHEVG